MDTLSPRPLSHGDIEVLRACDAWFLSSPTAAHSLALALRAAGGGFTPRSLAVVGEASLAAWQAAGGVEAPCVDVSTSGESMGLLVALRQHARVGIVRAQSGREDLPLALRAAGVHVHLIAAYEKTKNAAFANLLRAALNDNTLPKVLCLTSTDQVACVRGAAWQAQAFNAARVWASHPRVAKAALDAGFKLVTL